MGKKINRRLNRPSQHHKIARCKEKLWFRIAHELNKILLTQRDHDNLHRYHGVSLPHEQLTTFTRVNLSVCSDKVKNMLLDIMKMSPEQFYNPKILKKWARKQFLKK